MSMTTGNSHNLVFNFNHLYGPGLGGPGVGLDHLCLAQPRTELRADVNSHHGQAVGRYLGKPCR